MRLRTEADLHRGANCMADADPAGPLRELAASDGGDIFSWSRRCRRRDGIAAYAGAGTAGSARAAADAQYATSAAGRVKPRQGVRPRRGLRRYRKPDAPAL